MENFAARYAVATRTVGRTGDVARNETPVIYGDAQFPGRPCLRIPFSDPAWESRYALDRASWLDSRAGPILDPAGEATEAPFLWTHGSVSLAFDVFAAVFRILSGSEETSLQERDAHGRVPLSSTAIGRLGLVHRPVVDDWFRLLAEALGEVAGTRIPRRDLWNGHPFALCVTHDVDRVHKGWADALRRAAANAPRQGLAASARAATRAVRRVLVRGSDLYWNLDTVLHADQGLGARPTFFLMGGGSHHWDARYRLAERRWVPIARNIRGAGAEIALHGSYRSWRDAAMLERERRAVERLAGGSVAGGRQHFLRYDPVRTLQAAAEIGLRYDAGVGFAEAPGFRSGTALPFLAYDHENERPLALVVLPLVAMDRTLMSYVKTPPDAAWEALEPTLTALERRRGCGCVLWHNTAFEELCYPGWRELFEEIIRWARSRGAWFPTCAEAADAWERGI